MIQVTIWLHTDEFIYVWSYKNRNGHKNHSSSTKTEFLRGVGASARLQLYCRGPVRSVICLTKLLYNNSGIQIGGFRAQLETLQKDLNFMKKGYSGVFELVSNAADSQCGKKLITPYIQFQLALGKKGYVISNLFGRLFVSFLIHKSIQTMGEEKVFETQDIFHHQ